MLYLLAEIWVKICKLAVEYDGDIVLKTRAPDVIARCVDPRPIEWSKQVRQPAILRCCKTIGKEVLGHFYAQNTFVIVENSCFGFPPFEIHALLKELGLTNAVCMERMYFDARYYGKKAAQAAFNGHAELNGSPLLSLRDCGVECHGGPISSCNERFQLNIHPE